MIKGDEYDDWVCPIDKKQNRMIAKYWSDLFQIERNKLEIFPKFIIEIIDKYAVDTIEMECLVGYREEDEEYIFVKVFVDMWFITTFHFKLESGNENKEETVQPFKDYIEALQTLYEDLSGTFYEYENRNE